MRGEERDAGAVRFRAPPISADAAADDDADLRGDRSQRGKDDLVGRQRHPGATGARPGQVNVDVVSVEAEDLEDPAVGCDERSEDLFADTLDLLLYAIIHVGVRSLGGLEREKERARPSPASVFP